MTGYKLYFDPPASASGVVARDDTKQLVRFAVNKGCSEVTSPHALQACSHVAPFVSRSS